MITHKNNVKIVLIAGASASGKGHLINNICKKLDGMEKEHKPEIIQFSLDNYYYSLSSEDKKIAESGDYNFDDPQSVDLESAYKDLKALSLNQSRVYVPIYDFVTHSRKNIYTIIEPINMKEDTVRIIFVDGIFSLLSEQIRKLAFLKIYVQTDENICLGRRIERDSRERGRTYGDIINQYNRFVKPAYYDWILPSSYNADMCVPYNIENNTAIDMIIRFLW